MKCIRAYQLNKTEEMKKDREEQFKNCSPYYNDLFKAVGLDGEEPVMWALGRVDKRLAGKNLKSYGVPLDGEICIELIELDDEKKDSFNAHNYYDWRDYVFYKSQNDTVNSDLSIELLKCYTGDCDVEQVIFKESAVKHRVSFRTTADLAICAWEYFHYLYVVTDMFDIAEIQTAMSYAADNSIQKMTGDLTKLSLSSIEKDTSFSVKEWVRSVNSDAE